MDETFKWRNIRMTRFKSFAAASCLAVASMALMQNANADTWNKKTILTVNEPIQVPGKVLQPGKYVMKLLDSPSNRHIVQIYNEREDQLQTTILAIPNYRLQPTGKTEFQWWETPTGQPKALRAWFYPGDNFGQEFAYPKNMSVQIAQYTNQNVPTTYAETETDLATARVGTVDRAGTERELDQTYAKPATERPKTEIAQNTMPAETPRATPQAAAPAPTPQEATRARTELPETASNMPAIALAGFLALAASIAVRKLGNHVA
jgi:hypothetical protein